LVEKGYVRGWDDPRMPTLAGLRRRGFGPQAIRSFITRIGVAKNDSPVEIGLLEHYVREELNATAQRVMAVLRPLRLVITNYPEGQVEELDAINNPEDASMGTRKIPFSRVLYIEQDDFREEPPDKWFRLAPGREVRLQHAYYVTCNEGIKDASGQIVELRCTYDPATKGGQSPDGRRVKGTLHWVSAAHALDAEVRLYDYLFTKSDPGEIREGGDFKENLNPNSLEVLTSCKVEPSVAKSEPGSRYQFLRLGYFCVDADSTDATMVFNRTVALRDTWAKVEGAGKGK